MDKDTIKKENHRIKKEFKKLERDLNKYMSGFPINVTRGFERLEERVDSAESRIYSRLGELEDMLTIIRDNKIA